MNYEDENLLYVIYDKLQKDAPGDQVVINPKNEETKENENKDDDEKKEVDDETREGTNDEKENQNGTADNTETECE